MSVWKEEECKGRARTENTLYVLAGSFSFIPVGSRNQQKSSREGVTYFYFLKVILGIIWKMALHRERK